MKINKDDSKDLVHLNETMLKLAAKRLRLTNLAMLILSVYLFYNDYIMIGTVSNVSYRNNLFKIHIAVFLISLVYFFLSGQIKRISYWSLNVAWGVILAYIPLAMAIGTWITVNSIKVNLQINTYVTIVLFLAVFIPVQPVRAFVLISTAHIAFLWALVVYIPDDTVRMINQINATVTVFVSIVIMVTFYNYFKLNFFSKKRLMQSEENLNKLFEINPFPLILISRRDRRIIRLNKKAMDAYGVDEKERIQTQSFFANIKEYEKVMDILDTEESLSGYVVEEIKGATRSYVMLNCQVMEFEGEPCILAGIMDITKIKMIESELMQKASVDILTGVLNRMKGMEKLEQLFLEKKVASESFGIAFCDIDNLKWVNDTKGHYAGDELIINIVNYIIAHLDSDDFVFRFGGDEFIIVLKEKNAQMNDRKIDAIRRNIDECSLSASFGLVAVDPHQFGTVHEAMEVADQRMYKEKTKKKGLCPTK